MSYAKLDVVKSYLEKMDRDYRPKKILQNDKLRFTEKLNTICNDKPYSEIPDMKSAMQKVRNNNATLDLNMVQGTTSRTKTK